MYEVLMGAIFFQILLQGPFRTSPGKKDELGAFSVHFSL